MNSPRYRSLPPILLLAVGVTVSLGAAGAIRYAEHTLTIDADAGE